MTTTHVMTTTPTPTPTTITTTTTTTITHWVEALDKLLMHGLIPYCFTMMSRSYLLGYLCWDWLTEMDSFSQGIYPSYDNRKQDGNGNDTKT